MVIIMSEKIKGYKFDFARKTFTVNYKFEAAMNDFDSDEYDIYKRYATEFPMLKVVVKSGRQQKKPRYNKRLTYKNMRTYISVFDNSTELLNQFEKVIKESKPSPSPYKYVCDWFKKTFPNYKETPIFEQKEAVSEPTEKIQEQKEIEPAA